MNKPREHSALVADIGGTHARFGLAAGSEVEGVATLRCADYASLGAAARSYLEQADAPAPPRAAFAIAGPVQGDLVRMTNHVWSFSTEAVRRELDLDRLEVLNDFAALALAVPALAAEDLLEVKPGASRPRAPKAVLGPGTGLGMAALVPAERSWTALTTEGGHRDLAAQSEREWQVVRHLRQRFEHVSVERVLSGPGLVNLYEAVSQLADNEPQSLTPAAIVAGARDGSSGACTEATNLFSAWLGAVASDLALTLGAFGGIYLGGGILPKMGEVFAVDRFVERFLAKGRFRDYLRPIPVSIIVRPQATLLGAARALAD
jgi:glucokinase